jgi:hypothetical protein
MDQIHLSPLVDQIQLVLGHISNKKGPDGRSREREQCKELKLGLCWSVFFLFCSRPRTFLVGALLELL